MGEKKKKKKKVRKIKIEVGKPYLMTKEELPAVPAALQSWANPKAMSKEYLEMTGELLTMARYIALRLNQGPETEESVVKRTSTLKAVLYEIITHTFMDGYHRYGMLYELLMDIYMDIGGKAKTVQLLRGLGRQAQVRQQEKEKVYVT